MSAPSDTDVIAWLRAQGVDPDTVVPESVRGARTGPDECLLLFVERSGTGTYRARQLEVDIPAWARCVAAARISQANRDVMAGHLDEWLGSDQQPPGTGS